MHEIKGTSFTINVDAKTDGMSVILINHETNEVFEFPRFVLVGFDDEGEYVANICTIPELAQSLLRLHDLHDELKAVQVNEKPKLKLLVSGKKG
ncbi:hypothetical protein REC12_04695 [Desulfosporosinus sp. PR]|uniref:hypothetical protein n=1 Tax=Candidatus Desulfosporosinus nitrosoreducens TaxID=3401928 RepID=UPI0027F055E9|nr:hypothetical protein [Desulfosporosinus sp. PR]MDQ7092880.1 hypothetical protein [Desulfosporosinus sp. PR]